MITAVHQTYLDAKVEQEAYEQTVRNCQDTRLLPGLNAHLETLAIATDKAFWAWSEEIDQILNTPVELPEYITPAPQPSYIGVWHEDYANTTPGAA